jgi:hypothetical protein
LGNASRHILERNRRLNELPHRCFNGSRGTISIAKRFLQLRDVRLIFGLAPVLGLNGEFGLHPRSCRTPFAAIIQPFELADDVVRQ